MICKRPNVPNKKGRSSGATLSVLLEIKLCFHGEPLKIEVAVGERPFRSPMSRQLSHHVLVPIDLEIIAEEKVEIDNFSI